MKLTWEPNNFRAPDVQAARKEALRRGTGPGMPSSQAGAAERFGHSRQCLQNFPRLAAIPDAETVPELQHSQGMGSMMAKQPANRVPTSEILEARTFRRQCNTLQHFYIQRGVRGHRSHMAPAHKQSQDTTKFSAPVWFDDFYYLRLRLVRHLIPRQETTRSC